MRQTRRTASGPKAPPHASSSFAATQAAWRFLNNERVTLHALAEPLRAAGRQAVAQDEASVALLMHDWSKLTCDRPDAAALTHEHDVGYDLAIALLASADHGQALAPMQMHLKTGREVHSSEGAIADQPHIDQVLTTMQASQQWRLCKPLVHVIDREADSVGHYRQWHEAGHQFLVRADDRLVQWEDQQLKLTQVVQQLTAREAFKKQAETVLYRGKPHRQEVAQTKVILHKPARRRVEGRQVAQAGEPLELRLVIARVLDAAGRVRARWLLLSNVSEHAADAPTLAKWYYWRWRIESFFKLLKSHGHEVESWQQHTGQAVARRLLVCAMACVVVWELMRREDAQTQQFRTLLIRLSGRQMKRSVAYTAPALLAGLGVLLPMLSLLDECDGDISHLIQLAHSTLPLLNGDV